MGCPASSLGRGKTAVGCLRRILPTQKSSALCAAFFNFPDRLFLFHDLEGILVESANGAYPVVRDVFECRAGCDAAFGIALGRIIYVVAGGAMVFIWKFLVRPLGGLFNIYELLPAFIVALAAIVVVSLLDKKPSQEIIDEFESVNAAE